MINLSFTDSSIMMSWVYQGLSQDCSGMFLVVIEGLRFLQIAMVAGVQNNRSTVPVKSWLGVY
jgi:hypothetical protein